MVDPNLYCGVSNSNKLHIIFHCLNPINTLERLIWALDAWIDMSYLGRLVSPLVEATKRPINGRYVILNSTHANIVLLES